MGRLLACVPILLCAAGRGEPVPPEIREATGAGTGLRRLTLVARSEPRKHASRLSSVSCGPGVAEFSFHTRGFAASPAGAD
jgi:hypothetical protein